MSYCKAYEYWTKKQEEDPKAYEEWLSSNHDCLSNHTGSAAKMEVDGIKEMFGRSLEKHNVKYTRYIGDGDNATFKGILDMNPYDTTIKKLKCYLHVKKRMGTLCRNANKM